MLFNSIHYLVFLPVIVAAYFMLPYRHRWLLLLAASYYFYMQWKAVYALLLVISTVVDYFAGRNIEASTDARKKKLWLMTSLTMNLGILFVFKYYNFFVAESSTILSNLGLRFSPGMLRVLLPVGISFYTFQTMAYTIDVYRGKIPAEKHFGVFGLYVAYFPQLVAGPIERAQNLIPQLRKEFDFDYDRTVKGLQLILWGLFKKVVVADNLAPIVDRIYSNPEAYTGLSLIIATYFFAFQIFCDFSGYSDIAIGSSSIIGVDLMENFRRPYFSKSIREFWQRWHISLSTWFKDYLYFPLGGSRASISRQFFNVSVVFLVSGVWHGANTTFIVWGALHAVYFIIGFLTNRWRKAVFDRLGISARPRLSQRLSILVTFHLVTFAWIFFRAENLEDAIYIVTHLFSGLSFTSTYALGLGGTLDFLKLVGLIFVMESVHYYQRGRSIRQIVSQQSVVIRWFIYLAAFWTIVLFGNFGGQKFIYFEF